MKSLRELLKFEFNRLCLDVEEPIIDATFSEKQLDEPAVHVIAHPFAFFTKKYFIINAPMHEPGYIKAVPRLPVKHSIEPAITFSDEYFKAFEQGQPWLTIGYPGAA